MVIRIIIIILFDNPVKLRKKSDRNRLKYTHEKYFFSMLIYIQTAKIIYNNCLVRLLLAKK